MSDTANASPVDADVRTPDDAIPELRRMWPGCSFEIVSFVNAGFYQEPTRHVEIGVISPDYHTHQRWRGLTLSEALEKARHDHRIGEA